MDIFLVTCEFSLPIMQKKISVCLWRFDGLSHMFLPLCIVPIEAEVFSRFIVKLGGGFSSKWQWRRCAVTNNAVLKYYDPDVRVL
jgi:hypothetical protein